MSGKLPAKQFETGCDPVDVTLGGLFGGPADIHRRYAAGPRWYKIDGVFVSEEEFRREYKIVAHAYNKEHPRH